MQPSIDFVAALTSEPPLVGSRAEEPRASTDFVSVLSAEQGCDVCHELHASVYELRCGLCEAAICPDCARSRTDTTMACLICNARHPASPRPSSTSLQLSRASMLASLRQEGVALRLVLTQLFASLRALAQRSEGRISYTRVLTTGLPARDAITRRAHELSARAAAWTAVAQERGAIVLARSRVHASAASHRATALAIAMSRRGRQLGEVGVRRSSELAVRARHAGLALRAGARRGWARSSELGARGLLHTRRAALHGWLAMRSFPLRHHTSALLLTTVLLYAVARADHRE